MALARFFWGRRRCGLGTLNMMETIKVIHKEDVVLVKVGTFYTAYGVDLC